MSERPRPGKIAIRPLRPADAAAWRAMRAQLYPGCRPEENAAEVEAFLTDRGPIAAVLLAEVEGRVAGMLELGLRPHAEGCGPGPVPFVEGWFVAEPRRRQGIGRALMAAAEDWAAARGCRDLASDAEAGNAASRDAHRALGFEETETVVSFRKPLDPRPSPPDARPFRVRALGEIAIRCADLTAMTAFYRDVLGLPVLEGGHREGIVFLALGESYGGHTAVLALFGDGAASGAEPLPVAGPRSSLHHLALALGREEQEAALAWLETRGIPCRVEEFGWIGWQGVFLEDPEGNTVELVAKTGPGTSSAGDRSDVPGNP